MCLRFLLVYGKPGSLGGMLSWVVLYAAAVGVVYGFCGVSVVAWDSGLCSPMVEVGML